VVSVPGLARAEELHPVFVHDDGRLDTETGWGLLRRAAQFRRDAERAIPSEELPQDTLDESLEKAQDHITAVADQLQSRIADESRAQADRERARVVAFFNYREQTIQDKIDATRATLRRLQASVSEDDQKVVPLWRSNLERAERLAEGLAAERARRLSDIDQRLNPTADLALTSLTRIEVVPGG
jgi:hypothetical protein